MSDKMFNSGDIVVLKSNIRKITTTGHNKKGQPEYLHVMTVNEYYDSITVICKWYDISTNLYNQCAFNENALEHVNEEYMNNI